jgi:hypothetical protein
MQQWCLLFRKWDKERLDDMLEDFLLAACRLSMPCGRSTLLPPGVVSFLTLCFFVLVGRCCVVAPANLFGFFSCTWILYEHGWGAHKTFSFVTKTYTKFKYFLIPFSIFFRIYLQPWVQDPIGVHREFITDEILFQKAAKVESVAIVSGVIMHTRSLHGTVDDPRLQLQQQELTLWQRPSKSISSSGAKLARCKTPNQRAVEVLRAPFSSGHSQKL